MRERLDVETGLQPALAAAGVRTAQDLLALATGPRPHSVQRHLDLAVAGTTGRFWLKAYRYATWGRSLGLLGRGTLLGRAPCRREFAALAWLRTHDVPAVRPIAAASMRRAGRLVAQVLLTEWVAEAPDLAAWAARGGADAPTRGAAAEALAHRLGEVVGRMHALGFHHRDLHPRNVLVRPQAGAAPRVWLLDCRRGGRGGWRRRRRHDLRCLLEPGLVARAPFLAAYEAARRAHRG